MKECKHETFRIITKYFMDKPAIVELACCDECGRNNQRLKAFMQDRENETFKLYGEKSPYVLAKGIDYVKEATLLQALDPRIKDL